jgi:hypothetical protein
MPSAVLPHPESISPIARLAASPVVRILVARVGLRVVLMSLFLLRRALAAPPLEAGFDE